jgi:hypothetical protein
LKSETSTVRREVENFFVRALDLDTRNRQHKLYHSCVVVRFLESPARKTRSDSQLTLWVTNKNLELKLSAWGN